MTEPDTNEPPLVIRPTDEATPPEPPATHKPRRPRPGFWEAVVWCILFVMVQAVGALLGVGVVFTAQALAAADSKKFVDEQLVGFSKALDPNAPGERPAVPAAFGEALAWGMLAAQGASLALILVLFPRRIGRDWKRQLGVRWPYWLHVVLVLLIVPGFMVGADAIQTLFQWLTGLKPPLAARALNSVFGTFPWPLTALAVAIGPGVVEELWCRGFLGRGLSARYGLGVGVPTTAALFAAMHVDPSQLLVIAVMGVYLHFIYLATRSIWVPILLHASNNGLAICLALSFTPVENEVKFIPIVVHLAALALVLFGSVALWTSRAELHTISGADSTGRHAPASGESWVPEYPGISAPPPEANVRITHAPVSPMALVFAVLSFTTLLYLGYRYVL